MKYVDFVEMNKNHMIDIVRPVDCGVVHTIHDKLPVLDLNAFGFLLQLGKRCTERRSLHNAI
jgi:hypothetical protein